MGKIPTRDNFFIMSTGVYSCFQRSRPALNHQSLTTACGFDRANTGLKKFQLEISFTLILVWVLSAASLLGPPCISIIDHLYGFICSKRKQKVKKKSL